MTRLTAMIIQTRGDDVKVDAGGPDDNGKWTGWINLYKAGEYDHALISTESIYNTREAAITAIEDVINKVKDLDLSIN